jgi:hypothetical protein
VVLRFREVRREPMAQEVGEGGQLAVGAGLPGLETRCRGFNQGKRGAVGEAELDRENFLDRGDSLATVRFPVPVFGEIRLQTGKAVDQSSGNVIGAVGHGRESEEGDGGRDLRSR